MSPEDREAWLAGVREALDKVERSHPNTPMSMTAGEAQVLLAELLRLDEEVRRLSGEA